MTQSAPRSPRRRYLLKGLGVAGALVVGWGVLPPRQRVRSGHPLALDAGEVALNGWIKLAADGSVTLAMPRSEMGQGVHTALPMLVAEEMDVPLSSVRLIQAPIDKIFGNVAMLPDGLPFHPDDHGMIKRGAQWVTAKLARELGIIVTGGSSSVKDAWGPMREAGASARAMLVAAAAQQWNVPVAECSTVQGVVSHASGKRATYGELAQRAAGMTPGEFRLKSPSEFKLIGTSVARRDAQDKVVGKAGFGLDVRPQGMVYAAVCMSPTIGGKPRQVDSSAARAMPGVLAVVDFSSAPVDKSGVAVIANTFWQARQAVDALKIEWDAGPHATLSTESVFADLSHQLDGDRGFTYYSHGNIDETVAGGKSVQAEYRAPFLAHAPMEPINCTVQVGDGKVWLWASTQVPSMAVQAAARVAGIDSEQVVLQQTYLGGGFGRRLEIDMVTQAVAIARQFPGKPVQTIWTREEDMTHDVYRPAALARFNATIGADGTLRSWDNRSAAGSIMHQVLARSFGLMGAGPDKTTAEGEFDLPYSIPNIKVSHLIVPTPVPLGFWRSVGHSHNAFFKESFIDEVAHAAGKDPVQLRRTLLADHPRHLAVLDAAVKQAGTPPAGRAHGVALHQSFGTIVAQVAEVSVDGAEIRVHRVVCAVDCGIAVNPAGIRQQVESAVVFALSAALMGEITIKDGKVQQHNFHEYAVLRMNQAPVVETIIMPSAEAPEGMGEPAVPPLAPAVANAVFTLTGQRLRSLPLRLAAGTPAA